jgi:putative MATE family efflux protein
MSTAAQNSDAAKEQKRIRMTTQPVEKLICRLAIPTIISMLVTSFYNLADTFFIRHLERDSMVAAVGVVLPLMNIIQAIGFYHGHGSGNFISRAFGRKDFSEAEKMAATGFFSAVGLGLVLSILGLLFRRPFAMLLGAKTQDTIGYTMDYMRYILLATPFMMGSIVMNNQLRMQGNAFFSMLGLASGAVLNLFLDPILIFKAGDAIGLGGLRMSFGAGMGVAGAALATGISQTVSFVILAVGLARSDNVKIRFRNFTPTRYYFKGIFKGGLPSLARQGMGSIATASLNHAIGLFVAGSAMIEAAQAAMTGVNRIMMLLYSALIGFGQGFQPVCGFNYGARRYDRVLKAFWFCLKVAVVVLLCLSVLGFVFAEPVTSLIAGSSEEAHRIAAFTFRVQLVAFPLAAWVVLCNMTLQNIGVTGKATLLALARQGLAFIPLVFLLPLLFRLLGLDALLGIECVQALADVVAFCIAIPVGRGELRKMARLRDAENAVM